MAIKANLFYAINLDKIIGFEDNGDLKSFKSAKSALVFMLRGLKNKWSQPIAYAFSHTTCPSETLQTLLFKLVQKLKGIGLVVHAVISDMGSTNIQMTQKLEITPEKPYFFVDGHKIIYLFDTPHLIKSIRNNLLNHNFRTAQGQIISWKYICDMYELDKKFPKRGCPRLTDVHLHPNMQFKSSAKVSALR